MAARRALTARWWRAKGRILQLVPSESRGAPVIAAVRLWPWNGFDPALVRSQNGASSGVRSTFQCRACTAIKRTMSTCQSDKSRHVKHGRGNWAGPRLHNKESLARLGGPLRKQIGNAYALDSGRMQNVRSRTGLRDPIDVLWVPEKWRECG